MKLSLIVMAGLDPTIHVPAADGIGMTEGGDHRDKPGDHDLRSKQ
jgi:hypothetical protein